jgi:short-subunit dehydrogenase
MAVCPGPTATGFIEGVSTKIKGGAFDSTELVGRRTLPSFAQKKSIAYPGRFSVRVAVWLPRLLPRSVRSGRLRKWRFSSKCPGTLERFSRAANR